MGLHVVGVGIGPDRWLKIHLRLDDLLVPPSVVLVENLLQGAEQLVFILFELSQTDLCTRYSISYNVLRVFLDSIALPLGLIFPL